MTLSIAMTLENKNKMIWDALEWANKVNDKQGVIDCATAMGIDELRHCKGCMGNELHYKDQCVVCGTHNVWELFDVEVNPFTRQVHIVPTHSDYRVSCADIKFNELDEWASFEYQKTIYNVHFCYDSMGFTLNIYPNTGSNFWREFGCIDDESVETLTSNLEIKY